MPVSNKLFLLQSCDAYSNLQWRRSNRSREEHNVVTTLKQHCNRPMTSCLHRGQVRCWMSQRSTQRLWNSWTHGNTRILWDTQNTGFPQKITEIHSVNRDIWLIYGDIAARRFSCCAPPFGTVFLHLYTLLTVSLVLCLSSRLTCSQDNCSRSAVRASDTLMSVFRALQICYGLTYSE